MSTSTDYGNIGYYGQNTIAPTTTLIEGVAIWFLGVGVGSGVVEHFQTKTVF